MTWLFKESDLLQTQTGKQQIQVSGVSSFHFKVNSLACPFLMKFSLVSHVRNCGQYLSSNVRHHY